MRKSNLPNRRRPQRLHHRPAPRRTVAAAPAPAPAPAAFPPAIPVPPHLANEDEACAARLIVWAMVEEHRPARLVAARSAAEKLLLPQAPSARGVVRRLSEEQARTLVLNALRGVCRRPGLAGRARRGLRALAHAMAALLPGRKAAAPAATLHPITIELE